MTDALGQMIALTGYAALIVWLGWWGIVPLLILEFGFRFCYRWATGKPWRTAMECRREIERLKRRGVAVWREPVFVESAFRSGRLRDVHQLND